MNLILLFDDDFIDASRVRLTGRRLRHVTDVHRAVVGEELAAGVADGRIGRGTMHVRHVPQSAAGQPDARVVDEVVVEEKDQVHSVATIIPSA